ncbi:MAG TPA: hypothetical protein DCP46_04970, partial [Lachnospiraceae bacterium]|nr:hypothetical protein [Lachnospiraceae bacterium]
MSSDEDYLDQLLKSVEQKEADLNIGPAAAPKAEEALDAMLSDFDPEPMELPEEELQPADPAEE